MAETSMDLMYDLSEESINLTSSSSAIQSPLQGILAAMDREYEFFVTTEEPHQPEGVERGRIRRVVMRNFFEAKWAGPNNNASENNSASTVMAGKQLKSRFRLSKIGDGKRQTKDKRRDSSKENVKIVKENKQRVVKTDSRPTEGTAAVEQQKSRRTNRKSSLAEDKDATKRRKKNNLNERDKRLLLRISPGVHRFDPFDVLPVPGSPQLDTLFQLYKSGSKMNSIAINAKKTWWSFISEDAGLLHATLATWALYGMLVRGLNDLRVEKLRHKNEAIKEINLKIGVPGGVISDELVGTVLTLASFENLLGSYDAAQLHIAALKRMVNARGGLFAFGHNDGLIRGIMWVDFHNATAFHTPPSFPHIHLDPDAPPLPDRLLEEAACTSPTSLLQLSKASIDCFNIFYRLHRLSLAVSSHWISLVDRLTLSNLLYETEFVVLSVPDYSRGFVDFDQEGENEQDEDYDQRKSSADVASVIEALLAATQIFIYTALRELPPKAKIFTILLDRFHLATKRPEISTREVWKREKNLNMLVWVLVVVCSVAPSSERRTTWISMLSETMREEFISSQDELESALKRVAWTDTYFTPVLHGIWRELQRLQRAEWATVDRATVEQPMPRTVNLLVPEPRIDNDGVDWEYGHDQLNATMGFEDGDRKSVV